MLELNGKYTSAKVFSDLVEQNAISQIYNMCNLESLKDSKIRIMPDVHSGKGCTVGTTLTLNDKVIPNMVGVDIGCGMETVILPIKEIDLIKLDRFVRKKIPSGRDIRTTEHLMYKEIEEEIKNLLCKDEIKLQKVNLSLGTLGGGNHFIEIDRDDEGNLYLVIHSGSRNLGKMVASFYQKLAYIKRNNIILPKGAKIMNFQQNNEDDTSHLEGEDFDNYIHDMKIVQKFAVLNRKAIAKDIMNYLEIPIYESFTTIHNYIDTDSMILRKGSISANKDEIVLIPLNMKDGALICKGIGNEDWNFSAPHGAGRLYSRSEAKEKLDMNIFKESMKGIYSTSINESTLDESPMAYKDKEEILKYLSETVKIIKEIKPIYNFKASTRIRQSTR